MDDQRLPLLRTDFDLPDGRRILVYGELRGAPPPDAPRSEPTALHMRFDELSASWIGISPSRNTRPHSSQPSGAGTVPGSPAEKYRCPLCPADRSWRSATRLPSSITGSPRSSPIRRPSPTRTTRGWPDRSAKCEVVMFTERHEGNFATLTPAETARVVAVWTDRACELWRTRAMHS